MLKENDLQRLVRRTACQILLRVCV